jgi:hypothetical protein
MSRFTEPLQVLQLPDENRWRLLRGFEFWTDCDDGMQAPLEVRCATVFSVPEGFETDFASIPRLFWPVIGHPAGRYAQAAALHDRLYGTGAAGSRARADAVFMEGMAVLGVPRWRRWLMWAGVRLGGADAYREAVAG